MYRIPRIGFPYYRFRADQIREQTVRFIFLIYRPFLILLFILDTFISAILATTCTYIHSQNSGHQVARLWSRLNLALSGVSVSITGKENIDMSQPYIVMANHESHYDVFALMGLLPLQIRWIIKMELRKIPLFGIACEKIGYIFIDRGNHEKAKKSLEAAGDKIRSGSSVFFFPEGTRSRDGRLGIFKKGGFVIALEAGVPILPVSLVGGREILTKGSLRVMPGRMKVIIHKPIPVDIYTYETKEKLMGEVRSAIEKGL